MRKGMILGLLAGALALTATAGLAAPADQAKVSPAERKAIMDAMRPAAEHDLGAPVEFVVRRLSVAEGWAFVTANAQRKGGGKLRWLDTPRFAYLHGKNADEIDNALSVVPDCCSVQSILHKNNDGRWAVVEQHDDATDAWFTAYCNKPARTALGKACDAPD
ncbi:MAG: hypothetical protein JSS36_05875 [Proteobacteria bacterium]|nr:hypothetical protein [Pseudomonadota bacterium]